MPYNEEIDKRIRAVLANWNNTQNKKMFGGVCHLMNGNMVCGVYKDYLILRLGEVNAEKALKSPHVKPFDITGRAMKGWVMVDQNGFSKDSELLTWLKQAKKFVSTLPRK